MNLKTVNYSGIIFSTPEKYNDNNIIIETPNTIKNSKTVRNTFSYFNSFESYKNFKLDIETEFVERTCIVIQYMPINMMKEIKEKLLPKIGGSEFQINTIYTIIEFENFDLAIPIGYTTFKQRVTGGSVSFSGQDIKDYTEKLMNKYPMGKIANKLVLPNIKNANIGKIKRAYISQFNSTHRHPGKFSFSAVDTSMDKNEPGVLYTYLHLDNILVIDSVIYVDSQTGGIEVIDTWVRRGHIKPDKDGYASGKFERYNNVIVITNMIGEDPNKLDPKTLFINVPNKFIDISKLKFIEKIYDGLNIDFLKNIPYILDVDVVESAYSNYYNYNNSTKSDKKWWSRWL